MTRRKHLPLLRSLQLGLTTLRAHHAAALVCLIFIGVAAAYAATTPPFEAPDEASHFLYSHYLLETRQLPILEDRETVFRSQSVQRHHPPLYYLLGALLIANTERADMDDYLQVNPLASLGVVALNNNNAFLHPPMATGDTATAIWILRLFSIALGAATVWLIYRATDLLTGDTRAALLAALLAASIPTFIFISSSINNDNLVTMLYTAGIYWCARVWQRRRITWRDSITAGVILSSIALTKINGLTLVAVTYGWMVLGGLVGRFRWRQVTSTVVITAAMMTILAGWWYVRNVQLYGDPLALEATLRIWGRGGAPHMVSLFEAKGIWESFWFTLGQFNIRGADWLYDLWLPIGAVLAGSGIVLTFVQHRQQRMFITLLAAIGVVMIISLLAATSRINVSQGRLLFPALTAYCPLIVTGWNRILGRWGAVLFVMPLVVIAVTAPLLYVAPAYDFPEVVDEIPLQQTPAASWVNVTARGGDLTIVAYRLHDVHIPPDRTISMDVYLRGSHPDNPYLSITALDPRTGKSLGGINTYPGMMPTTALQDRVLYAVPVQFQLDDPALTAPANPYQMKLVMSWNRPLPENGSSVTSTEQEPLELVSESGLAVEHLIVQGPTVTNIEPAAAPQFPTVVLYGNAIRLTGYTLSAEVLHPGEVLTVTLNWQYAATAEGDWMLAIGLWNAAGEPVLSADGSPANYPTSAWQPSPPFADLRTLPIPMDLPEGSYRLYIGWYRLSDGARMEVSGAEHTDNLFVHPFSILVCKVNAC